FDAACFITRLGAHFATVANVAATVARQLGWILRRQPSDHCFNCCALSCPARAICPPAIPFGSSPFSTKSTMNHVPLNIVECILSLIAELSRPCRWYHTVV